MPMAWTADGKEIIFFSSRNGPQSLLPFTRPHATYSRHLFTSAEDLVQCYGGHHAEVKG
jgi:hypothetical protein